ncbi:glutamate ABC transporter, ATP-binding protein GluA [Corynebacterium ammoniagenes DSM 20306]|uniref:Glutamate ABC transporter, ATP-binding protein GluA n=2 Tax=Corynebacterium ammoniagenes TaxID=1697 RepID=A0ABP2IGL5_CORAM|nr:glutamate ABC transporter, ATP-binding protein GluA [Corynebacterium ammoniagenes DSM 20306]
MSEQGKTGALLGAILHIYPKTFTNIGFACETILYTPQPAISANRTAEIFAIVAKFINLLLKLSLPCEDYRLRFSLCCKTHAKGESEVTDTPMIRMSGVQKFFDDFQALKDIDLEVAHGEVVVVLGPSGSGKSTLCRTINRLETIEEGTIEIDGTILPEEGNQLAKLRADVGMVFQQFNLFPHLTILDNVTLGPIKVRKLKKSAAEERAMQLLDRVGIGNQASKYPAQLSGGQQQRVVIARALAMEPKIMLFDEPTSALDPEMVNEVLDVMASLVKDGMTMVVVTHEMGFARRAADRILFMADGEIVEDSDPANFFDNPQSDRAKDFLGKILSH